MKDSHAAKAKPVVGESMGSESGVSQASSPSPEPVMSPESGLPKDTQAPFWETRTLQQMSREEWESLCDGCGRCCLQKIKTDDEHLVRYTRVACRLLDVSSCRCSNYRQRNVVVPECITLDATNINDYSWLPRTCAYRRINENRGLADWHPLVSGSAKSVHRAGVSVAAFAMSETHIHPDDFPSLLIDLPGD